MVLKRRKWKQIFLLQGEKMKKYIKNTKTKRQEPKRRKKSYKDYFGKK